MVGAVIGAGGALGMGGGALAIGAGVGGVGVGAGACAVEAGAGTDRVATVGGAGGGVSGVGPVGDSGDAVREGGGLSEKLGGGVGDEKLPAGLLTALAAAALGARDGRAAALVFVAAREGARRAFRVEDEEPKRGAAAGRVSSSSITLQSTSTLLR